MDTKVGLQVHAAEANRLKQDKQRRVDWKRWGPYLSERQWATVREDYSADGNWYEIDVQTMSWANCIHIVHATLLLLIHVEST